MPTELPVTLLCSDSARLFGRPCRRTRQTVRLSKSSWSSRCQPFCRWQRSWQNMTIITAITSHNWRGWSATSVRPTKLAAFATEAFVLDKHYFDKSLERNTHPSLGFIAVLRKNYALAVGILRDPSVGNGSLKKGSFRVKKLTRCLWMDRLRWEMNEKYFFPRLYSI